MLLKKRLAACVLAAFAVAGTVYGAGTASAGADKSPDRSDKVVSARPIHRAASSEGPTYNFVQSDANGSGIASTAATSYLPFNFTYDFSTALNSRMFWPSGYGQACVNLRATGSTDPNYASKTILVELWDADGQDTKVGYSVSYALDGYYYGFCWNNLHPTNEHYFRLVKNWGPSRLYGDGWASAS